jgi:SAM-dependent methyltransferase
MSERQRWEDRFSEPGYRFGTAPNDFLKSKASLFEPGQNVLAVADGEGRNGVFLAEQGLDVLSVDISPRGLAKARALAAERGVSIQTEEVDLETWTWPEAAFDVIVVIFIQFAEPALRERIFSGIKQALKPGGLLLLQGYRPKQLGYGTGGPNKLENLYTRELLEKAFGELTLLEIREHDSVINEGAGHVGMSALIDLVARK